LRTVLVAPLRRYAQPRSGIANSQDRFLAINYVVRRSITASGASSSTGSLPTPAIAESSNSVPREPVSRNGWRTVQRPPRLDPGSPQRARHPAPAELARGEAERAGRVADEADPGVPLGEQVLGRQLPSAAVVDHDARQRG